MCVKWYQGGWIWCRLAAIETVEEALRKVFGKDGRMGRIGDSALSCTRGSLCDSCIHGDGVGYG